MAKGYDPKQPRDEDGQWTDSGGGTKRWGRMNSTEKAQLTSRATFNTKLVGPSKKSKGRAIGTAPAKVFSDERLVSHYHSNTIDKRKGKGSWKPIGTSGPKELRASPATMNLFARKESPAAIAIQTAKALDRDFHQARDKANQEAMKAALARSNVQVTKLPPGKKSKYGPKGKMK